MKMRNGISALEAPIEKFDDKRIVPLIRKWLSTINGARSQDLAKNALSQVLRFAMSEGLLDSNKCLQIPLAYRRPQEVKTWTLDQEEAFRSDAPDTLALAQRFIRHTGLRRKDAVEIPRSAIMDNKIVWQSSKSRRRRRIVIPILPELRAVLDDLDKLSMTFDAEPLTILFNSHGRPWSPSGFSTSFDKQRKKHGIEPTIHCLRKNAATDWVIWQSQLPPGVITDDMICRHFAWEKNYLEEMKAIYVDDDNVIEALTENKSVK